MFKKIYKALHTLLLTTLAIVSIILFVPFTPIDSLHIDLPTVLNVEAASTSVNTPSASHKNGSYLDTQIIKLTCKTKGTTIYYTTNGKKPTSKSIKYTKPIKITKDTVIRAIAIKNKVVSKELIRYIYIYDYTDIFNDVERYELAIKNKKINRLSIEDQKVCNEISKIIDENITVDMSDYDKIKTIHDYIVNINQYDIDNYNANTIPLESYAIKGVILNHKSVCQGYAETFQVFMNLLGIENKFISNDDHAWNLVKLDDNWYHVDVTWDDPVSEKPILSYNYFLVNDAQIGLNHTWDKGDYPICKEMNYQIYKDAIIDSINNYETKFRELYNKGNKEITILYPENTMPNMDFYFELTGYSTCWFYDPVKFGDYYMFTVVCH